MRLIFCCRQCYFLAQKLSGEVRRGQNRCAKKVRNKYKCIIFIQLNEDLIYIHSFFVFYIYIYRYIYVYIYIYIYIYIYAYKNRYANTHMHILNISIMYVDMICSANNYMIQCWKIAMVSWSKTPTQYKLGKIAHRKTEKTEHGSISSPKTTF